jgi:hypothetical protein
MGLFDRFSSKRKQTLDEQMNALAECRIHLNPGMSVEHFLEA